MSWAFEQDLPCAHKFVLVVLGDLDHEGSESWVGVELISERCGIPPTAVMPILTDIAALGLASIRLGDDRILYQLAYGLEFPAPRAARKTQKQKQPISATLRVNVWRRDGFKCVKCESIDDLTADHIVPESLGGPTTFDNLRTLCRSCNSRKGTKLESAG